MPAPAGRRSAPRWRDVRRGAGLGLGFAMGLIAIAAFLYALAGGAPRTMHQPTLGAAALFYVAGSVSAGGIAGALIRGARRAAWLAYVVAVVAAIPVSFGAAVLMSVGEIA